MDHLILKRAGEALYGNQWQTPLATALNVSDRTMRRWVSGDSAVPDSVIADIERVARQRVADIYTFMAEITSLNIKR